jgi:hypothetical protein
MRAREAGTPWYAVDNLGAKGPPGGVGGRRVGKIGDFGHAVRGGR